MSYFTKATVILFVFAMSACEFIAPKGGSSSAKIDSKSKDKVLDMGQKLLNQNKLCMPKKFNCDVREHDYKGTRFMACFWAGGDLGRQWEENTKEQLEIDRLEIAEWFDEIGLDYTDQGYPLPAPIIYENSFIDAGSGEEIVEYSVVPTCNQNMDREEHDEFEAEIVVDEISEKLHYHAMVFIKFYNEEIQFVQGSCEAAMTNPSLR